MTSRDKLPGWRFAALLASTALLAGMVPYASVAHADPPAFHMLDNGRLRFGGNSDNSCWNGCATVSTPEDSVSSIGLLKQPFYFSTVDSKWHKLTYYIYPLNLAIGTGTTGANWSGSTVFEFNPSRTSPPDLVGLAIDTAGYTSIGPVGLGDHGYGTVVSNGTATINGQAFAITEKFELGPTSSFVKITTTLRNVSGADATNVNMWVGTQDDYVGSNDGPKKTKGNLVGGAFTPTTDPVEPASALMIESGPEGVLFYSTTPTTNASIEECCSFGNAYNLSPTTSPQTLTGDGSYSMNLPVGALADGASAQIVWYYGAGATADLVEIADAIATAANPPVPPTSTAGNHQATVSWAAPTSASPITDYSIRHRIAGSSDAWVEQRRGSVSDPLTIDVTALDNGISYEFQVAGVTGTFPNEVVGIYSVSTTVVPGTPVSSGVPTIAGAPGSVLSVVDPDSNWSSTDGSPMTATYQWQSDGIDIPGANSADFRITAGQAGTTMRVIVTRTNASGAQTAQSADVTMASGNPSSWTDDQLGAFQAGVSYADGVAADGFPAPLYSVSAGTLPAGLTLDAVTGAVIGEPTTPGAYTFTITASNGVGDDVMQHFEGTIAVAPTIALEMTLQVGASTGSAGATALVHGDGLQLGSDYEVVMHSAPTILATGTVDADGSFSQFVTIPANAPAGSHALTVSGTDPNGDPRSDTAWFSITALGKIGAVSNDSPIPEASAGLGFVGMTPSRVLDTRESGTPIAAGTVQTLHLAGEHGVPADAKAVALTVTVTESDAPGFLTVYPCGTPVPTTSNVNWIAGQTIANRVITALDAGGSICLFSDAATHLVVDLNGAYIAMPGASPLTPLAAHRLLDTRDTGDKAAAGSIRELQVSGTNGVPADASAVVLNVTSTRSDAPGFVTVFPCGTPLPTTSTLNFDAGQTISNSVTATIGSDGKVCLFSFAATDLVIDLNSAYSPTLGTALYSPQALQRLLDTRASGVEAGAGSIQEVQVTGPTGVPADATGVVLNVTATESGTPGFVTVFPCGTPVPTTSNLNFNAGQTIASSVTATIGSDGKVCLFTHAATHLVVDLDGAYVPAT